ncbi:poly(ADP-ribose) glycohydrolase isoform X1 [Hydra vulgaris]|uniref:poly(ADP-ribose) glycohydrolase isoform X1 n=1 Tax=Hydra vulgaris TaxID=6087 RepID=UPI0032EA02F4
MSEKGSADTAKRKKQHISISDYFSKRKKVSLEGSTVSNKEHKESFSTENMSAFEESEAEKILSMILVDADKEIIEISGLQHLNAKVDIPNYFNRMPCCSRPLPHLKPSDNHSILFDVHSLGNKAPQPYPEYYKDYWDKTHVRMPCSDENLYPTSDKKIQKRWDLIEEALLKGFQTSKDLEDAVLKYNHHYKNKWNFEAWHSYCNIYLDDRGRDYLFKKLLPSMVRLALQLPNIVTQSPKLLQKGRNQSLTFSQKQISCLLANAFFCTYPRRNSLKTSDCFGYPDINFSKLFRGVKDVVNCVKTEKLKAILNYFGCVIDEVKCGTVTYTRKILSPTDEPDWKECNSLFTDIHVSSIGNIEDNADGLTQIDFANRMIGGGVVGEGCVQEEIRFLICPELILARLFTEKLEPNESLLITGIERFSTYSGYAQTFKYRGRFNDLTPVDRWGRRYSQVLAIDAHVFHCYSDQFKKSSLKRELNKAFCGFLEKDIQKNELPAIATGNWGCGAFGGDIYLKALLQLMAASNAGRNIVYFTFGDEKFANELTEIHKFIQENSLTVGNLWNMLLRYKQDLKDSHIQLYPYIKDFFKGVSKNISSIEVYFSGEESNLEMSGFTCEIPDDMESNSPEYAAETP